MYQNYIAVDFKQNGNSAIKAIYRPVLSNFMTFYKWNIIVQTINVLACELIAMNYWDKL